MKKKLLSVTIIAVFCLLIATASVNAWFTGQNFTFNGQEVMREGSRTGSFKNQIKPTQKHTAGTVRIDLSGKRKVLGVWVNTGSVLAVNISGGVGVISNPLTTTNTYSASGTNDVRVFWTQKTAGHITATITFP